jgi:hypothetical protein
MRGRPVVWCTTCDIEIGETPQGLKNSIKISRPLPMDWFRTSIAFIYCKGNAFVERSFRAFRHLRHFRLFGHFLLLPNRPAITYMLHAPKETSVYALVWEDPVMQLQSKCHTIFTSNYQWRSLMTSSLYHSRHNHTSYTPYPVLCTRSNYAKVSFSVLFVYTPRVGVK